MTTRARQFSARVVAADSLSDRLVRLVLSGPELTQGFVSTGIGDEWVGLVVPGQYQSRYYTVRSWDGSALVLDVVRHDEGLVTEWVSRVGEPGAVLGEAVTVSEPKGSFDPPAGAEWVHLVGDLTALPAMARVAEEWRGTGAGPAPRVWAEVPEPIPGYFPEGIDVVWHSSAPSGSRLAALVETLPWPEGVGYFWMAGESAQMRAIRKFLMSRHPGLAFDVMGYWRAVARRQPRRVDPAPIWRAGKASGHTDAQIWAAYDAAREAQEADR